MDITQPTLSEIQKETAKLFVETFGRTPLRERLADVLGEATELSRATDIRNLREEFGDLLATTLVGIDECGWDAWDLIQENREKLILRKQQYASLGRKIKVAILGGAFDPVTKDHLNLAQFVLNTSRTFDEVWLLPCVNHMYGKKMTSVGHRLAMLNLAVKRDARIKVCQYEIENNLSGETYHTVKRLLEESWAKNQYDFSWIIGMDNANTFDKWVNYELLEKMIRFVVVSSAGRKPDPNINWYLQPPHIYLEGSDEIGNGSSSMVRAWFMRRDFHKACYLVEEAVSQYIVTNGLYECFDDPKEEK